MKTTTPLTDAVSQRLPQLALYVHKCLNLCAKLELDLATVTKERDELREKLAKLSAKR